MIVACASPADAQPSGGSDAASSTLLLVRSAGDERVVPRVVAELGASGWSVAEIGPDAQLERAALSDLASARAVIAALRVHADAGTMELWIARAPGATDGSLETLSAADADERVPALRVTEALRARGLIAPRPRSAPAREEPPAAPKPPPEEPKPHPAPEEPKPRQSEAEPPSSPSEHEDHEAEADELELEPAAPPRPLPPLPRMWIELAPAGVISAGSVDPAFDAWVSVRYQPGPRWSIGLLALVPIWSERLQHAPEGSARVSTLLAGAGADLHLQSGRFELGLRGGAGAAFTFMSGDANENFRSAPQTIVVAALFAGPSVHLHLGGGFRLALRLLGGTALPRVAVRFAEHVVAHWGRPFGVATLGVEYAF